MKVYVRERMADAQGRNFHAFIARIPEDLLQHSPLLTTWFTCRLLLVFCHRISACARQRRHVYSYANNSVVATVVSPPHGKRERALA